MTLNKDFEEYKKQSNRKLCRCGKYTTNSDGMCDNCKMNIDNLSWS